MSPRALGEAKPDRAETSAIAALAGFAFGDAFAVSQCVPAIISATGRLIARTLLSRPAFLRRGLVLFRFDACGSAHYWAREMETLGHEVKLIAPQYARPFVKRQKNDAADAEAIVIAARQ